MANYTDRYLDNAEGPYFVDFECISCDTCTAIAKKNFRLTEDFDHAIVFKQPDTPEEISACEDALNACPVLAIGVHHT